MAYRSILTISTSAKGSLTALGLASRLARAQDAHLDVLAIGVDLSMPAFTGYPGTGMVLTMGPNAACEAATAIEAALRQALAGEDPALRWSIEADVAMTGDLPALCALHARYSDLVVLPRPHGQHPVLEDETVVEAALFGGGAPVLLVPDDLPPDVTIGSRPVVAWNGSNAALAAVRRALPFLMAAKRVNVVIVDPSTQGSERSDPGGLLCRMLARHGVTAEVSVLARSAPRTSDVLRRHIRDLDGDLLVMGAYGHSRLREAVFGGVTRDILLEADVPVFMAH